MVMKILIIIFFFEIKESKITRGHNFTLVKKQSRLDSCDDVDNGLDNTCEVIIQETVLFSTPETDNILYD